MNDDKALELMDKLASLEIEQEAPIDRKENNVPVYGSSAWQDYVFSKLEPGVELFEENGKLFPSGNGLRRVVEDLLGPVLESYPEVIQAPRLTERFLKDSDCQLVYWEDKPVEVLEVCVVKWVLKVNCLNVGAGLKTFGELASSYYGNLQPMFMVHPAECAASKAEARCLRKAFKLNCLAREEKMPDPYMEGPVNATTLQVMKDNCSRLKIHYEKFLKKYARKYLPEGKEMPKTLAHKLNQQLNGWYKNADLVPQELKV